MKKLLSFLLKTKKINPDNNLRQSRNRFNSFVLRRALIEDGFVSEKLNNAPFGYFSPHKNFYLIWNSLLSVLVFYITLTLPFYLSFYSNLELESNMYYFYSYLVMDFTFIWDMVITFRTGIELTSSSGSTIIIFNQYQIMMKYVKSYFFVDIISNFPYDLVIYGTEPSSTSATKLLRLAKITKMLKLIRLLKISRVKKLGRLMKLLKTVRDIFMRPSTARLLQTLLLALLITHVSACIWYASGTVEWKTNNATWVNQYIDNERFRNGYGNKAELYIISLYWCISTLTSVGYGDIVARNSFEMIVAIVISWTGATIFGFMLGYLSQIVSNLNKAKNQFHERMDSIGSYLTYRKVPTSLRTKVTNYFQYFYTKSSVFDEKQILEDLSNYLRVELSMFLTSDILSNIDIFRGLSDPSFFSMIVTMLRPLSAAIGDIIYFTDELASELYIILKGGVEMISGNGYVISRLLTGDHFGELDVNKRVDRRKYTARASEESDLFSLSKIDLIKVCECFPQVNKQIIESIAKRKKIESNLHASSKIHKVFTETQDKQKRSSKRISFKLISQTLSWALTDANEVIQETKLKKFQETRKRQSIKKSNVKLGQENREDLTRENYQIEPIIGQLAEIVVVLQDVR